MWEGEQLGCWGAWAGGKNVENTPLCDIAPNCNIDRTAGQGNKIAFLPLYAREMCKNRRFIVWTGGRQTMENTPNSSTHTTPTHHKVMFNKFFTMQPHEGRGLLIDILRRIH